MNKKCPKCGCFLKYICGELDCEGETNIDYYKCNNKNCDWLESDEVLEANF